MIYPIKGTYPLPGPPSRTILGLGVRPNPSVPKIPIVHGVFSFPSPLDTGALYVNLAEMSPTPPSTRVCVLGFVSSFARSHTQPSLTDAAAEDRLEANVNAPLFAPKGDTRSCIIHNTLSDQLRGVLLRFPPSCTFTAIHTSADTLQPGHSTTRPARTAMLFMYSLIRIFPANGLVGFKDQILAPRLDEVMNPGETLFSPGTGTPFPVPALCF